MLAVAAALVLSMLSDSQMSASSFWRHVPGYGALLLHSFTSSALDHTLGVLSPSLGNAFTLAAATLGASVFALPFYVFRTFLVRIFAYLLVLFR
jgi:zinc transporter 5/7